MTKPDLVGRILRMSEGGLAAPLDRAGLNYIQAQANDSGRKMEVKGTALRYGVVGHFGYWGAVRMKANSVIRAPGRHRKFRDIMGLYAHDAANVLAREGNNTMGLTFDEGEVSYWMMLNENDPLAVSVWAKLMREDVNASSVGVIIRSGEWVRGIDNGLDSETAGSEIDIYEVEEAWLVEVSVVAQGAFAGATSFPSGDEPAPAMEDKDKAEVEGSAHGFRVTAAYINTDGKVEADGTETNPEPELEGQPAGVGQSDTGDDPGSGGAVDGGAAPDGGGEPAAAAADCGGDTDGGDGSGLTYDLDAWLQSQSNALKERGLAT